MTEVNKTLSIAATLGEKWKRDLEIFEVGPPEIFVAYADKALTGFVGVIDKPVIGTFRQQKCVIVPLTVWMYLKQLGADTVTPFRIVAQGKNLIAVAFAPHTGLKFAVRSHEGIPQVFIPVEDFKVV